VTDTDKANTQLDHQQHQTSANRLPICLLINDLKDPLNIGSLFRLADSFNLDKIYLTGTSPTPPNPKIRKTARHTDTFVDFSYNENALEVIHQLKNKHYQIICLELSTQSIDINTLQPGCEQPICLIIGEENAGVNQSLLDLSDLTIHIPMRGRNSSMNVSTATAIALYELAKQFSPAISI